MLSFVLIHGAWHKPSCWDELKKHLHHAAPIYTPQLVCHSDYVNIRLSSYIQILSDLLLRINGKVILIAHSFGGFVAGEIANLFGEKINHIIYINGLIPMMGESLFSLCANFDNQPLNPYLEINTTLQEIKIHPLLKIHQYMYQTSPLEKLDLTNFRAEPLIPLTEGFSGKKHQIREIAIISRHDLCIRDTDQIQMSNRQNIPYHLIHSDHSPFQTNPVELYQLILKSISDE